MPDRMLGTLIERLASQWLTQSEVGEEIVAAMGADAAVDAVFELLNSGLLKLIYDPHGHLVGLRPCLPAQPPKRILLRPGRRVQ